MAWFQHEVGMFDDRKVKKLRRDCGFIGYGLWCFLLEQIAKEGTLCRLSPDYSPADMSIDTEVDIKTVNKILDKMADVNLINKDLYEKTKLICIPQFSRYYDEYHRKVKRKVDRILSEQHPASGVQEREIDREIDRNSLIKLSLQDPILKESLKKIGVKV